jgi:hypothetical protein
MRRVAMIIAALFLGTPCVVDAGGRIGIVADPGTRIPEMRSVPPPRHRPHRSPRHRFPPGLLGPVGAFFPASEFFDDRPDVTPDPAPVAQPPAPDPPPVAEPKMLFPPAPAPLDPTGARSIVIQRGDQLEVQTFPPVGRP